MVSKREVLDSGSMHDIIYEAECKECKGALGLALIPDADDPVWQDECCGYFYTVSVTDVEFARVENE